MASLSDIEQYLIGSGVNPTAAAGITAGIFGESGGNENAVNPTSGAYGLTQVLGARQSNLFNTYGSNPTWQQQLDNLINELPGNGGSSILNSSTPQDALNAFVNLFERPGASGAAGDISRGNTVLGGLLTELGGNATSPGLGQEILNGLTGNKGDIIGQAIGGGSNFGNSLGSIATTVNNVSISAQHAVNEVSNIFSINTAQRATAVIVGSILALLAVSILIAENKTVQEVVTRTGKAAALVA